MSNKLHRGIFSFIICLSFLASMLNPGTVLGAPTKTGVLMIDGNKIVFKSKPIIKDGCFFVPLKEISTYLNINLVGDNYNQGIQLEQESIQASIQTYNLFATVMGKTVELEKQAFVQKEIFYVPMSFIANAFHYVITSGADSNVINISKQYFFEIKEGNAAHVDKDKPDMQRNCGEEQSKLKILALMKRK